MAGFIEIIFCRETHETKKDLTERIKTVVRSNQAETITGGLNALAQRWDTCSSLGDIAVPVLIMCGKEDTITPPVESEVLHKHIANSVLHIIDKAGHLSNLEQPDEFNAHLGAFIKNLNIK